MSRPGNDGDDRVSSVLAGLLGQPNLRRGLALGRLARRWEEVVGPALAAQTWPLSLDGTTLVVAAAGSGWATQARFLARDIGVRAAAVTGSTPVSEVRVVVRPDGTKPQVNGGKTR